MLLCSCTKEASCRPPLQGVDVEEKLSVWVSAQWSISSARLYLLCKTIGCCRPGQPHEGPAGRPGNGPALQQGWACQVARCCRWDGVGLSRTSPAYSLCGLFSLQDASDLITLNMASGLMVDWSFSGGWGRPRAAAGGGVHRSACLAVDGASPARLAAD